MPGSMLQRRRSDLATTGADSRVSGASGTATRESGAIHLEVSDRSRALCDQSARVRFWIFWFRVVEIRLCLISHLRGCGGSEGVDLLFRAQRAPRAT